MVIFSTYGFQVTSPQLFALLAEMPHAVISGAEKNEGSKLILKTNRSANNHIATVIGKVRAGNYVSVPFVDSGKSSFTRGRYCRAQVLSKAITLPIPLYKINSLVIYRPMIVFLCLLSGIEAVLSNQVASTMKLGK